MMVDRSKNKERDISLRNKIVDCAVRMFEKKGIKDVAMDDISKRLSISKRTLYEIFEDKETLLLECMKKDQDKRKKEIEKVALRSSDVLEVILYAYLISLKMLHRTNLKFFQDVQTYPRVNALINERREENLSETVNFFKKGVEQGLFRPDINFEIFISILHDQISALLSTNDWRRFSFFDVYDFVLFTFLRGVSTEKGVKIIDGFIENFRKNHHSK